MCRDIPAPVPQFAELWRECHLLMSDLLLSDLLVSNT